VIRFVAMIVVTLAYLSAAAVANAQPEEGVYYRIKNVNSKKFLALGDGAATSDETQIVQRSPAMNERAQWKFVPVGKHYRIVNRKTGQELSVHSKDEGEPILARTKVKHGQWSVESKDGSYVFKSRHSGLVIDVAEASKDRKAPVIQYPSHEGHNQLFELEPVKD